MAKKIDVAGRLHCVAVGNILTGADEILDDNEQKKQSQINAELIEAVENLSEEMDTKQGAITAVVTPEIEEDGGDPAVESSFENNQLNLEFKNLKGEQGNRGNGITSIETQESQEDGGVNVVTFRTNDNQVGQTFQVKNGRRGAQGVSFQPIADVSGLLLAHAPGGDNSKAMSQKGVTEALDDKTVYISNTWEKEAIDGLTKTNPINPESGLITSTSSNPKRYAVKIRFDAYRGQHIRIMPNGENVAMVAFLTGWPGSSPAGKAPSYCEDTSLIYVGPQIYETTVPGDCVYLYIAYQWDSDDVITPSSIDIISLDVKGKISGLENAVQAISDNIAQLEEDTDDDIDALDEKLDERTIYIEKSWTKSVIDGMGLRWPIDPETNKFVSTSTSSAPYRRGRRIENASEYRGRRIRIAPNGDNVAMVAFLKSWPSASGQDADYCDGTALVSVGTVHETVVPDDCTDIYVAYQWDSPINTGNVITPSSIDILINVIDKVSKFDQLGDRLTIDILSLTGEDVGSSGQQCGLISVAGGPGNHTFSSGTNGRLFPMVSFRGKTIQIVANPDYRTRFAFLKSFEPGTGKPVYYCEGEESYHEIAKDQSERAVVPGDCAYLYVENYYSGHYAAPTSILITQFITDVVAGLSDNKPSVIYLSEDGDDENDGQMPSTAKATFDAALNAGSKNMEIVLLSDIHHGVDLNAWNGQKQHVTIRGGRGIRPRIILGRKLEGLVAYNEEYEDVYTYTPDGETLSIGESQYLWQHELEDENTLISSGERHPLQKGRRCRSLSTKLKHANDLETLLAAEEPCWCVANNVLYLRVAEDSDVAENPIYIPGSGENALTAGEYDVTLSNIECWYGKIYAGQGSGNGNYLFKAVDCAARYSCGAGAWVLDDAISSHLERCEADGNTMYSQTTGDGFNMSPSTPDSVYAKGSTHTLIDCWSHDNRDDGYSDHGRSEGTIIGGLFEYNKNKGGITPSYGSHDTVYYATVRQNKYGIFSCADANDGGVGTQTVCFGCVAISNNNNYACQGGADQQHKLILNNCISRNSRGAAIVADGNCTVIVRDCTDNSSSKKSATNGGAITIDNGTIITE